MNIDNTSRLAHRHTIVELFGMVKLLIVFCLTTSLALFTGRGEANDSSAPEVTKGKPNILLIVADDMGFSDLGVYGGEISTPVLDRLSREGVQFTQFHVTPNCAPT